MPWEGEHATCAVPELVYRNLRELTARTNSLRTSTGAAPLLSSRECPEGGALVRRAHHSHQISGFEPFIWARVRYHQVIAYDRDNRRTGLRSDLQFSDRAAVPGADFRQLNPLGLDLS